MESHYILHVNNQMQQKIEGNNSHYIPIPFTQDLKEEMSALVLHTPLRFMPLLPTKTCLIRMIKKRVRLYFIFFFCFERIQIHTIIKEGRINFFHLSIFKVKKLNFSTYMNKSRYIATQFLIGMTICPTMNPEYPSIAAMCVAPN
jgi:hypothetical protein